MCFRWIGAALAFVDPRSGCFFSDRIELTGYLDTLGAGSRVEFHSGCTEASGFLVGYEFLERREAETLFREHGVTFEYYAGTL